MLQNYRRSFRTAETGAIRIGPAHRRLDTALFVRWLDDTLAQSTPPLLMHVLGRAQSRNIEEGARGAGRCPPGMAASAPCSHFGFYLSV